MVIEHLFISHEFNFAPDSVAHDLLTLCCVSSNDMILYEACVFLHHHRALRFPDFLSILSPLSSLTLPAHHLLLPVVDLVIHILLYFHVLLEYVNMQ